MEGFYILLVWGMVWGFIGLIIADRKGRGATGFVLGFFFAFIGLLFILFLKDETVRLCPKCGGESKKFATVCPHCNGELVNIEPKSEPIRF